MQRDIIPGNRVGLETPPSEPESRLKRPRLTARSPSQDVNVPQTNLRLPSRYNQRKPWGGIFGLERELGDITILRRQDADKPKGDVPSWLADTFGVLQKNHPLREVANGPIAVDSRISSLDDDNPFAYQPPSPSRAVNATPFTAFPDVAQRGKRRTTGNLLQGLSSIPFAPPTFVEPTYEDHYQDVAIPLNDFYDHEPKNSAYWTDTILADHEPEPVSPILRATLQSAAPQRMSSPLFLPSFYPPSPITTTPVPNTISSDDTILSTPTHDILGPEADEIQDALRAKHPFVTSIYTSSPTRSFREFPLDTLLGSRKPSPYTLASTSSNTSIPSAIYRQFRTPGQEVLPESHIQPRPASSDVYKSKLLEYATVMTDHMTSSGDEGSMGQRNIEHARSKTEWRTSSPVTQHVPSPSQPFGKAAPTLQSPFIEGSEPFGHNNGHPATPIPYPKGLDTNNCMKLELAKLSAIRRSGYYAASIHSMFPELCSSNRDRGGDDLGQKVLDDNLDLIEFTYLEGPENEPQIEDSFDKSEEDRRLLSQYESIQMECDVLAAGEPSDEESEATESHVSTSRRGSSVERSAPEADNLASAAATYLPKKNPKIQPFPMKVSRNGPTPDATAPGEDRLRLTRLSPKFIPQPPRHVELIPFSTLLKKQFKDWPDVVELENQITAGMEDRDEIESWSG
ncbi:unnamed protein product [Rhizoctonia solani]|uniref:Uncharacterized protein n=1 Tax=Rhizoctonia solani TaxID=456999 RepID=A0A8H2WAY3_9AGAM|nr:unnamed protein product [Rhizoctonia solani]